MRATVMFAAGDVRIQEVADPTIVDPTDAIVRVTSACVYGSDLWPYADMEPSEHGQSMGHEAIQVTDEGMGRTSEPIEAAVYFCAREAIQNTAKHAGPGAKVTVTFARRWHAIEFAVSDDGRGMPRETDTSGMGITGMRDRIDAVGGEFEIIFAPGQGMSIRATIPDDKE